MSVPLQICNGTVHMWYNFYHLQYLIKLHFCVWCAKCAKNLTFGTFSTSAAGALILYIPMYTVVIGRGHVGNKKGARATASIDAKKKKLFYTSKTYFFYFTHLFLQNTPSFYLFYTFIQ